MFERIRDRIEAGKYARAQKRGRARARKLRDEGKLSPSRVGTPEPEVKATLNEVQIHYRESDKFCSIIVNGVEIAGMVEQRVEMALGFDDSGKREGHLDVRYGLS